MEIVSTSVAVFIPLAGYALGLENVKEYTSEAWHSVLDAFRTNNSTGEALLSTQEHDSGSIDRIRNEPGNFDPSRSAPRRLPDEEEGRSL